MGIYLPNMEMPRKGQMLVIFQDGTSYVCFNGMRERLTQTTAVPVPPHGDLIDMNAKIDVYDRYDDDIIRPTTVRGLINEYISGGYPRTIIPAEEGDA